MIRTAQRNKRQLGKYLELYRYQPELTAHLDTLPSAPFSQQTINEIVLWKVNRYVRFPARLSKTLHGLRKLPPKQHRQAKSILEELLDCRGVDLAMASTILRFQNARTFQIIDRHAYRALTGKPYRLHTKTAVGTK